MFAPRAGRYLLLGLAAALLLGCGFLLLGAARIPSVAVLTVLGALLLFLAVFFRDPERTPGPGIVSAADGRVREVVREGERWRVSVFMNVTDVHVNRFPLAGRVTAIADSGDGFRPAYRVEARHNRQRSYTLATGIGTIEVVQMTGLLARRLVSLVRVGDDGATGGRLGMIVLGSRVDVLFPVAAATPLVRVGARVRAGTSSIARPTG